MADIKINYFDFGLYRGTELRWITEDIFPRLNIKNYKAYGFEVCGEYADGLSRHFINNEKVDIINRAIGDHRGTIKLYYSANSVGHSIFDTKNNVDKNKYEIVESIKFSDWVLENVGDFKTSFNILKVNIEGAEWHLFNDLCNSGLNKYIHIFCGQGHDVDRVGELEEKVQDYYKLIEDNNIKLYRFTEWKPHKNDNIERIIKEQVVEFYRRNNENI